MSYIDKAKMFETNICPICSFKSKEILVVKTINNLSNEEVRLLECLDCSHWWHSPMPSDDYLIHLYSNDDFFVTGGVVHSQLQHLVPLKVILRYVDPILKWFSLNKEYNYLELGSGAGHLLNYFSSTAKLAIGIEPSPPIDSTNTVKSIDLLPKGIFFDLLVAQDVLEHLNNPINVLTKLRSKTNKGGVISIGVPNKDSLKAKLMKDKWSMIRPLGHLHYFSKKSIIKMLYNSGWEVLEIKSVRMGKVSAKDLIREFDYSLPFYRIIKSLFLGQIILGKDQWYIQARAK